MAVDKRHERMLEEILKAPGNGVSGPDPLLDLLTDPFPRDMCRLSCHCTALGFGQSRYLHLHVVCIGT